jgi:mannan endo-1,4-beta-mannosidase
MMKHIQILLTAAVIMATFQINMAQQSSSRTTAINPALVTPGPIENATRLYNFLKDNYRKKIISGVMTLNSMDEVNWLKANTGKEPVVIGLDFMHCNRNYDWYNDEEPVNDARTYYNRNGIPVFCWHWRDPSRNTEEFYTNKTAFDISKVNDTSSPEYAAMINDIDYIAGLLKILNDEGIPVIWRPLHEAAGGWFWWGAKGAAPCKKLYQVMWDRMVNHHGLKNLIWVWTREPNDDAWYPGDAYVDIVSRDIYKDGDHSSQITEFNSMVTLYGGKKMVTLSETGSFPDVDNLIKDGAGWSWWMPWYGKYTREATYNPLSLWKKMFAHNYVITLDEMPNLKTYEAAIVTGMESSLKNSIRVYPTIIHDGRVTIEADHPIGTVSITNSMGAQVKSISTMSHKETMWLPFPPGVYLLKTDRTVEVTKIVIR